MTSVEKKDHYLPRLEQPSWLDLYPSVADEAAVIYDGILRHEREHDAQPVEARFRRNWSALEQIEVLNRLASDQRMKRVWHELYRRSRGSNEFLNPVRREGLLKDKITRLHDPKSQDMAVRAFFNFAVWLAAGRLDLITQDGVNSKNRPFSMMASRLRKDAGGLRALGLDELATDAEAVASDCEKSAYIPKPNIILPIVKRSRGDDVTRGFVLRMSGICREGFGNGLPGTVATTASVALSKPISAHQVRDIVRAHDPRG